jgi:hypothetical protein
VSGKRRQVACQRPGSGAQTRDPLSPRASLSQPTGVCSTEQLVRTCDNVVLRSSSMDQVAGVIVLAIFFGVVFTLGEWLFRRLTDRLDARLHAGWRWLTLPVTAFVSSAGFLVLRPLVVDQPRTPLWFVLALVAVALLVTTGTALGYAVIALGRGLIGVFRRL